MRRWILSLIAILFGIVAAAPGQAQDVGPPDFKSMRGFDSSIALVIRESQLADKEALETFKLLLIAGGLAGLEDRIHLRSSEQVANAVATINDKQERFIIYSKKFMQEITERTQNYWPRIAILAHEAGHHFRFHTTIQGFDHKFELEADYQAGFILGRMGSTLAEAQAVFRSFDKEATKTHPGRDARLEQVKLGWDAAQPTAGHALKAGVMFGKKLSVDFSAGANGQSPRYLVAAEPYLRKGPIAITVESRVPDSSNLVFVNNRGLYAGRAVEPTVSENYFTQADTGNVPASFTLRFSKPLQSFTFVVPKLWPATSSGITFPGWRATALSSSSTVLAEASEELLHGKRGYSDVTGRTVTLQASPAEAISAVRIDSDPRYPPVTGRPFAAFSALLIEQIILEER